ncbi:MAG: hypothetical protein J0M08_00480 [Bacteroidetes bacterium]|nr:hypothetical protein [Bacteroidota bacterium]
MKNTVMQVAAAIMFLFCANVSIAQSDAASGNAAQNRAVASGQMKRPPITKPKTKAFLRRTAVVIQAAKAQVQKNKNFTGDLSKAISHQRYAKQLYAKGMLVRAVQHSKIARIYTKKAIAANKGNETEESRFTAEENELLVNAPKDEELTADLTKQGLAPSKDEDVVSKDDLDIDLSDKE